ncbi:MAG: hypothetical protein K8T91_13000 [Planctomycetes bacterium]|nr:hypothetical protein [Planctomycetota bacterium]
MEANPYDPPENMEPASQSPPGARTTIAHWLTVCSLAILVYPALALSIAWFRAWQLDYYPFQGKRGLDGPWDHLPEVELWVHSAMNVPLLAVPTSFIAACFRPTAPRFVFVLAGIGVSYLVAVSHYWLID